MPNNLKKLLLDLSYNKLGEQNSCLKYLEEGIKHLPFNLQ